MALADHFGIENNDSVLENLRNIPATEFVQLSDPVKDQELIGSMAQVVDGFFFPERFHEAYRNGTTHNIPYITGFNANEGTSLFPLFTPKEIFNETIASEDWLNKFWQSQNVFTDKADSNVPDELREYEKSLGLNPYESATQIWGDFFFGGPAYYAAQKRSEDDLTHIYSSIIKNNTDLAEKIANNASPNVIEQLVDTIQYLVAMIVNNKISAVASINREIVNHDRNGFFTHKRDFIF